ncbi:MAG: hypothetical protein ACXU95_18735 [Isosphaeraceae bacterium]
MNVLIDVNVALDVILERQPWLGDSKGVWDACYQMRLTGHLVATGLTNLFSISRRIIGTQEEREHQPGWNGDCPCNWPPYSLNLAFDRQ